MRQIIFASVFSSFLGSIACAGGVGTASGEFLNITASTRSAGMGEAFTGVSDDIGALYHNPAGLAQNRDLGFNYLHAFWMESINYDYLSAVAPMGRFGTAGMSFTRIFTESDKISVGPNGEPVFSQDVFDASDTAVTLGYAYQVESMTSIGASVKMITQDLNLSSGNAYAFDAGVSYQTPLPALSTGIAVNNIGSRLDQNSLPMMLKVGGAYELPPLKGLASFAGGKNLWDAPLFTMDVNFQLEPQVANFYRIRGGLEYKLALGAGHSTAFRIGYKYGERGATGIAGLTYGLGYAWTVKRFHVAIDYALVNYGDLGMTHRLAMTTNFLHLAEATLGSADETRKREKNREGQVFIQWPPSSDPQVSGYNVYVGESRDGNFSKVNSGPIRGTSLSVKGLKVGRTYFFFVTTVVGIQPAVEGRPFYETASQATPIP